MFLPHHTRVYLAAGNTDMRKQINGLAIMVADRLEMDALSGNLFVYCNRQRNPLQPDWACESQGL